MGAIKMLDRIIEDAKEGNTTDGATLFDARLLQLAVARQSGQITRARRLYETLQRSVDSFEVNPKRRAALYQQAALLALSDGDQDKATARIAQAISLIDSLPVSFAAKLVNDRGLIEARSGKLEAAEKSFLFAAEQADVLPDERLKYRLNAVTAQMDNLDIRASLSQLDSISQSLFTAETSAQNARNHLAAARLYRRAAIEFLQGPTKIRQALRHYKSAAAGSRVSSPQMAQIAGELSILYFEDGQLSIAEAYVRNALVDATATNLHSQVIRWEGQLAKVLHAQNKEAEAQAAVARAVAGLQHSPSTRQSLDFAQVVKPIYSLYADLQLAEAPSINEAEAQQSRYRDLQETLEAQKFAEVQDYFGEDCVASDLTSIQTLGDATAVLYPVILPDRLELLLSAGRQYSQHTVAISSAELSALITDFRINIQADAGNDFHLKLSQQLYNLLIAPLEASLRKQRIEQLVFVPEGSLRTIPLGALHDGEQYLIEKFALATTPGITLLAPQVLATTEPSAFAGGISESVQGFAALPGVAEELQTLGSMLSTDVLENASFTSDAVKSTLASGKFSLVHLATHGQFNADHEQSFLLTYNGRVTLDDLSSTIALRPSNASVLELLVLSACETAAGDDRAALGLAGVALKAGARSAVATLWPVDDAATRALIERFYTALLEEGHSRSLSLQKAQQSLIREQRFQHPAFWAPYLLIGNWL